MSGVVSNLETSQIVDYEYVKSLSNHPEKLLIDVREPGELVADGKIPFSINIPGRTQHFFAIGEYDANNIFL